MILNMEKLIQSVPEHSCHRAVEITGYVSVRYAFGMCWHRWRLCSVKYTSVYTTQVFFFPPPLEWQGAVSICSCSKSRNWGRRRRNQPAACHKRWGGWGRKQGRTGCKMGEEPGGLGGNPFFPEMLAPVAVVILLKT